MLHFKRLTNNKKCIILIINKLNFWRSQNDKRQNNAYCKFVKQSKAKQSRELYLLTINSLKTFLIILLSFTLLFSISCSNEDTTGGGNGYSVQTNSNHPPIGSYTYNGLTNTLGGYTNTVTHNGDGSCTIAGRVSNPNDPSRDNLNYKVTVKSWLNYSTAPNLNYVGTMYGGEYTITEPGSSFALDSFRIIYNTATETIQSVSLSLKTTSDVKYYNAIDLKRIK